MLVNNITNNYNQPHKLYNYYTNIKSSIQLIIRTMIQRKNFICNFLYYFFLLTFASIITLTLCNT